MMRDISYQQYYLETGDFSFRNNRLEKKKKQFYYIYREQKYFVDKLLLLSNPRKEKNVKE